MLEEMILSQENQFKNYHSMTQQKNLNQSNLYFYNDFYKYYYL